MNWLRNFMWGRNGADQLCVALVVLAMVITVVCSFTMPLLGIISYLPMGIAFFRMFSKNVYKRQAENAKFLQIWNRVVGWFRRKVARIKDSKYHKYYRCPGCGITVRVPKGKGKICITCPKCRKEFIKKT